MPGGFVLPWLEVTALAALVAYASWVLVERPAIEAVGRWRPWTRRVPSFPAELPVKPVPGAAGAARGLPRSAARRLRRWAALTAASRERELEAVRGACRRP